MQVVLGLVPSEMHTLFSAGPSPKGANTELGPRRNKSGHLSVVIPCQVFVLAAAAAMASRSDQSLDLIKISLPTSFLCSRTVFEVHEHVHRSFSSLSLHLIVAA